jgi:hypothetical protein
LRIIICCSLKGSGVGTKIDKRIIAGYDLPGIMPRAILTGVMKTLIKKPAIRRLTDSGFIIDMTFIEYAVLETKQFG